ncbi:outer membrane beta-barrel protein [Chitinophaga ginsengisoli]|uniref:Outer membrane protein with beta-barrel domain n=1 Tax=Chitinophaga ginsengisoli TaxID=363837 RepID=A0A2P8GAD0_9BACT|nr:outer membrane beta-barrel protein [Chitinophaga ginsengisoli]PSL30914.1 outer membrane protein with beta-barrel domain [Chitinophaga ginsengisoli]
MKKLLLLALLAISMLPVYSQTSVGVIAGYNAGSRHPQYQSPVGISDYSPLSTWRAGLVADHHLWKKFYLQPQLLLNNKGEKEHYTDLRPVDYTNKTSTRLLSLELQANFIFKQEWGKGKFFVGAGPYLGRGISGKCKYKGYNGVTGERFYFDGSYPVKYKRKVETPDPTVLYQKPYDAGINFQAGYELKNGLFFNAVYSRGLNYQGYNTDGNRSKSTYWGVSVGYLLKKFS